MILLLWLLTTATACTVNVRGRFLVLPSEITKHIEGCEHTPEGRPEGTPYLDRSPVAVELVLDWIHSGLVPNLQKDVVTLLQEARFFKMAELQTMLEPRVVTVDAFVQFLTDVYHDRFRVPNCGDLPVTALLTLTYHRGPERTLLNGRCFLYAVDAHENLVSSTGHAYVFDRFTYKLRTDQPTQRVGWQCFSRYEPIRVEPSANETVYPLEIPGPLDNAAYAFLVYVFGKTRAVELDDRTVWTLLTESYLALTPPVLNACMPHVATLAQRIDTVGAFLFSKITGCTA